MAVKDFSPLSLASVSRRFCSTVFAVLLAAFSLHAQTPKASPPAVEVDDDKPISVKTDLVTQTLTVTDLYGRVFWGVGQFSLKI
jgi:hypothetical protein